MNVAAARLPSSTVEEGSILRLVFADTPYRWRLRRPRGRSRPTSSRWMALAFVQADADHDLGYELLTRFARVLVGQLDATRVQLLDLYRAPE